MERSNWTILWDRNMGRYDWPVLWPLHWRWRRRAPAGHRVQTLYLAVLTATEEKMSDLEKRKSVRQLKIQKNLDFAYCSFHGLWYICFIPRGLISGGAGILYWFVFLRKKGLYFRLILGKILFFTLEFDSVLHYLNSVWNQFFDSSLAVNFKIPAQNETTFRNSCFPRAR